MRNRSSLSSGTTAQTPLGILDVYTNAAAAYSLRKLTKTYTGNSIRVRKSSDNSELDIGFDSLGYLDIELLLEFLAGDAGFITTWYDQSGNAKNANQLTASSQPVIVTSGVVEQQNNRVGIRFTGSSNLITSSSVFSAGSDPYYVHVVAKASTQAGAYLFSAGARSAGRLITGTINTASETHTWWTNNLVATQDVSIYKLRTYAYDGSIRYTYLNNSLAASQSIVGKNTASTALTIGSSSINDTFFNGLFLELVIYNSNLVQQRSLIQTNAVSYYGIT